MRRDVMHYFNADVKAVYLAYLTAAQNKPFERTCEQKPYYCIQFGLNFSMKFNMNGGSCTLHFIPYQGGTAVNLRFSVAQLAGARYEAYDRALTDKAIDILRVPAQTLRLNVEEFLQERNWLIEGHSLPQAQPVQQMAQPTPAVGKRCGKCSAVLMPDARFCSCCGAPTETPVCSACGKQLLPNARFCSHCGQRQ